MTLEKYKEQRKALAYAARELVESLGAYDGDLDLDYIKANPDERFEAQEAQTVARLALALYDTISYLDTPIEKEGVLHIEDGELFLDEMQLHCGYRLEVYTLDDDEESYTWRKSHVEHTPERGYFLFGFSSSSIAGMEARIRG